MISAKIVSDIAAFQANVTASAPLNTQTQILIQTLEGEGASLLQDIDAAIDPTGAPLDAADPSGFVGDMVGVLTGLATASEDQTTLSDLRGLVGRAMFNLAQVSP
jgi:hypothetical protein